MTDVYMPGGEAELVSLIQSANAGKYPLEVCGFRSKREAGRPIDAAAVVSTAKLSGITFYEPGELVISARAGTPLHEIEEALARKNQELAFEPVDLSRIYGTGALAASIGSVVAMNISGPRRILRGAARDYLLGVRAVNGEGAIVKSGGRVMKNVTGVDLVRGLCGSWGTLAVLTELTFKVLPKASESRTVLFLGLADEAAVGVMSAAMGTPYEVSGTIHLHGSMVARLGDAEIAPAKTAVTALRLEGSAQSVADRVARIRRELAPFGETYKLDHQRSRAFWSDIRSLVFLSADFGRPIWRIAVAPSKAPAIVARSPPFSTSRPPMNGRAGFCGLNCRRRRMRASRSCAVCWPNSRPNSMLMRAPRSVRSSIQVFHPLPFVKMELVRALKKAFDPAGVLNPGRMYAGV